MNCKEFSRYIGDYIDRALGEEAAGSVEMHLGMCKRCAALVQELESASLAVRSLERKGAPSGFEARLKARLAVQKTPARPDAAETLRGWLGGLGGAFSGAGVRGLRPVLAGLLLCAVIAGSLFIALPRGERTPGASVDWAYIDTCREQHMSFAAANPLADDSALILRERSRDLEDEL